MKLRLPTIVFLFLIMVSLPACQPDSGIVESVSLDFPYGEARLLIRRGGEARLAYAELPDSLLVQYSIFNFDALMDQLQPRLYEVVTGDRVAGRPFGTATLDYQNGSTRDYFMYDSEFAEGLFLTACRNLFPGEEKKAPVFNMVCEERIRGTSGSA
jgi:hypothetical protein